MWVSQNSGMMNVVPSWKLLELLDEPEVIQGTRYEKIMGIPFEIQVRTILMDAWANVSHYLDYKKDSSIPSELRRDFYALSGLFYVADKHFEMFFGEKVAARSRARLTVETVHPDLDQELNLETLQAYLHRAFPNRKHADPASAALLVDELIAADYTTLAKLETALLRGSAAIDPYETAHPPSNVARYTDVGVVRFLLSIVDARYLSLRKRVGSKERFSDYRRLMRAAPPGERFVDLTAADPLDGVEETS
jgi:putative GTP pyrophosphokinase